MKEEISAENTPEAAEKQLDHSINLSGERKTLSSYVDSALIPQMDLMRAKLQMMGYKSREVSKAVLMEAALVMLINDFNKHEANSFLVEFVEVQKDQNT